MGIKEKTSELCAVTYEYKLKGKKQYTAFYLGKFDSEWLIIDTEESSDDYSDILNEVEDSKEEYVYDENSGDYRDEDFDEDTEDSDDDYVRDDDQRADDKILDEIKVDFQVAISDAATDDVIDVAGVYTVTNNTVSVDDATGSGADSFCSYAQKVLDDDTDIDTDIKSKVDSSKESVEVTVEGSADEGYTVIAKFV